MFDKKLWAKEYRQKRKQDGYYNSEEFKKTKQLTDKKSYLKHREERLEKCKEYYNIKKTDIEWYKKETERKRILSRDYHNRVGREHDLKRKLSIINHYGPNCKCCGVSEQEFLALDHIEGKGNQHRREIGVKGGKHFYDWIIKNNFPTGFQILCHNCNFAKDHFPQGCPHSRQGD